VPPLTILPRRATLLNTGEAVGFDITDLPRLYKENPNRCLRLKQLPITESGTAGWVIKLEFDQLPATPAKDKQEETR
jgi:hypothetical protein